METNNTTMLSVDERRTIYDIPIFLSSEREYYFTLNQQQIKFIRSLDNIEHAVYFIISLAYFKKKQTIVEFTYQHSTYDRRYVMQRYFHKKSSPKTLPDPKKIIWLENKVLHSAGYKRINPRSTKVIQTQLEQIVQHYPKQNQLFKALLNLMITHKISIPGYRTMQQIISVCWNKEINRLIKIYYRNSNKTQRNAICSLTEKNGYSHQIISICKDMKCFNTTELKSELEKHQKLDPIFTTGLTVIPKLKLPDSTIEYYASLVNYYGGWKLKSINKDYVQIYLLCYCYMRYKSLNDNLTEAFKKRISDYEVLARNYVKEQALAYQDNMIDIKNKLSNLLISMDNILENNDSIPARKIFKHIPKVDLLPTAQRLINETFDPKQAFWEYIENEHRSIQLNIRPIFQQINFTFTNKKTLEKIVTKIKELMQSKQFKNGTALPNFINKWLPERYKKYIILNGSINIARLEFLLYRQLSYRINANDVSLQHSFKYKQLEDDLTPKTIWDRNKRKMLKSVGYPKLLEPINKILKNLADELSELYKSVNGRIDSNENASIKVYTKHDKKQWRVKPLKAEIDDYSNMLFSEFKLLSIIDVIKIVDSKTHFSTAFEPIEPRGHKKKRDISQIMAVVLANAIRIGSRKMAKNSDLKLSELLSAENSYVRVETLRRAADIINNEAGKLTMFKQWNINGTLHGSMDGTKIETALKNVKARNSQKYFHDGMGVSSFNMVTNSLPLAAILIGANEYEGHYAFELFQHGNTTNIKPVRQSGDGHSLNQLNFALFFMVDKIFMPRIPSMHNETLYGFGSSDDYKDYLIHPHKYINEQLIIKEWSNIQRIYYDLINGTSPPSVIIKKLSAHENTSPTKKAFWQLNNIIKSIHVLRCIDDEKVRRGIYKALNRGEAYHNLCRAIALNKGGKLKGYSEIDLTVWNECTRLIAAIMIYYNTYILSALFNNAGSQYQKLLINSSPIAWAHINLLGFYQFRMGAELELDKLIKAWEWKKAANLVKTVNL